MRKTSRVPSVFLLAGFCTILSFQFTSDPGDVTIEPAVGVAGNFGTWTVTHRVGAQGVATGGSIRVQLPDTWHAGDRNSANRLQATDPHDDHYVSANTSRQSVQIRTTVESETDNILVKQARPGLDGRAERYVFVVRVEILEGELQHDDTISVIYGDTSQGSRGMRASIVTTPPEPVLVAVDLQGSGEFRLHDSRPTLHSRSGPAARLRLTGPSSLVKGQASWLHLAVVDINENPVDFFKGDVSFRVVQGEALIPASLELNLDRGWESISFTPGKEGILRIEASALGRILQTRANPMSVETRTGGRKIYWGDLHSHTQHSWDGVGYNSFQYARHVSGLDFYAVTDHSRTRQDQFTQGLGPHIWETYTAQTDRYNEPEQFVTLHAYEASFRAPYGHHNVFFRDSPGPLLSPEKITLPRLWQSLTAGEALTIPHHTGKFPQGVSWDFHNADIRRNFEIYSAHGLSETYDPDHPLAFEQSDFTAPSRSADGPQFAQDAWAQGLILSTIAASDDHRSQPGKPHWGLAAVWATGLNRSEIFDALYERRSYGTTGARILLDFSVNDQPMGQRTNSTGPPLLKVEAHASYPIELVEILRYSAPDGTFKVIKALYPRALDFLWSGLDRNFREDSIYYVRLRQEGQIRNRIAMAWSSPIWVSQEISRSDQ